MLLGLVHGTPIGLPIWFSLLVDKRNLLFGVVDDYAGLFNEVLPDDTSELIVEAELGEPR